jgi:hypothetical protein
VSCEAGVLNEKDCRTDYLEFKNTIQQVARWKMNEFEPTLEGGDFGRRLQVLRSNPQQLCIYLNHLLRYYYKDLFLFFILFMPSGAPHGICTSLKSTQSWESLKKKNCTILKKKRRTR